LGRLDNEEARLPITRGNFMYLEKVVVVVV
jgi:hypothetical protein